MYRLCTGFQMPHVYCLTTTCLSLSHWPTPIPTMQPHTHNKTMGDQTRIVMPLHTAHCRWFTQILYVFPQFWDEATALKLKKKKASMKCSTRLHKVWLVIHKVICYKVWRSSCVDSAVQAISANIRRPEQRAWNKRWYTQYHSSYWLLFDTPCIISCELYVLIKCMCKQWIPGHFLNWAWERG